MTIPSNGFHVDAEGFIVLGLSLVVAVVALPSIWLSTVDSWQRFQRERDFQRLLQATLRDLKRPKGLAQSGLGVEEEFLNEPALNSTVVRTLLGDDQFPYARRAIKVEP